MRVNMQWRWSLVTIRRYSGSSNYRLSKSVSNYLKLNGVVKAHSTFGEIGTLNQSSINQPTGLVRDYVIVRDNGFDLGVESSTVPDSRNYNRTPHEPDHDWWHSQPDKFLLNPDYLISVSLRTHNTEMRVFTKPAFVESANHKDTKMSMEQQRRNVNGNDFVEMNTKVLGT